MKKQKREFNKKKIILLIIIVALVIFEVVAFKQSKAENTINIIANVTDDSTLLSDTKVTIQAQDGGSGYYIILPDEINGKKITKYVVTETIKSETTNNTTENLEDNTEQLENIENNVISTNTTNEQIDNIKTKVEYTPGKKVYLSKDEESSKNISLLATYDKKEVNKEILYNQTIEKEIDNNQDGKSDNKITISGYMPSESKIIATKVENEEIKDKISDYTNKKVSLDVAYDIKISYLDKEYEPTDFDENVQVVITGIRTITKEGQKYKVLHIDDNNQVKEISDVNSESEKVTFQAEQFSTYAVLMDSTDTTSQLALFSLSANANVWDGTVGTKYAFGDGTSTNPYLISNGEELAYLASMVNNGTTYAGSYFQLINDIDLNYNEWTPIGNHNSSFRGIFDGCGHIIANAQITISSIPSSGYYTSVGLFGSVGGGSSYSIVKNIEIDDMTISINASGNVNSTLGFHIGAVTGDMYSYSKIENIIVKGASISDPTNYVTLNSNSANFFVGGIAGFSALNSSISPNSGSNDSGDTSRGIIANCFVSADIDLDIVLNNYKASNALSYAVGGILGCSYYQLSYPTNCLYTGTISATYAYIGPIYGQIRNSTSTSGSRFTDNWEGSAVTSTIDSYFTDYTVNNQTFNTSCTSSSTPVSYTYRLGTTSVNINNNNAYTMSYVQGVNKGIYTDADTDTSSPRLDSFNAYAAANSVATWLLEDDGTYSFNKHLTTSYTTSANTYTVSISSDDYADENTTYTYAWYINGTKDNSLTTNVATIEKSYLEEKNVQILVSDGTYKSVVEFTLEQLVLNLSTTISGNKITAAWSGSAVPYVDFSKYTYKWYKIDVYSGETTEISGATAITYTKPDTEQIYDYKIVATHSENTTLNRESTLSNRTVIYVDSNNGSNNNDGLTPETAVRTMDIANGKLTSDVQNVDQNIVVVIGNYYSTTSNTNNTLLSATKTCFASAKKMTITGKYAGTDYSAQIYLLGEDILCGNDRKIQYLSFRGNVTNTYNGNCIIYAQGHNLTMGQGLHMIYYSNSNNTTYGLYNATSPNFHVVGGFLNYNSTSLPSNNGTVTIQSGTYARIIAGTRNSANNNTSGNITGSSSQSFNIKIIIDIEESTTDKGRYPKDINFIAMGQTDGSIYANAELDMKEGTIGRIIGGSIGNSRAIDKYSPNTFWGSSKMTIEGGTIAELYGASLGRQRSDVYFYGAITINIVGGTIENNVYGAGAGGVTGYSANSTDPYKTTGEGYTTSTTINISGGTIKGNVYGGGYGYSAYLGESTIATDGGTLYGDSTINITGGTITGSIYGASRGYGYSSKTELAEMYGTATINISNSPSISGTIYGAGEGLSRYPNTAKLTGASVVNINTNLAIEVYGAGNIGITNGTTTVNINSGTHTKDIYGGGNVGEVTGTTNVYMKNGTSSNIYGGGNKAGATNTNIYMQGGTLSNIYGGSNNSGDITNTHITLTTGTVETVYGGNNLGGTCNSTNITSGAITVNDAIYGGGNKVATDTTNVTLNANLYVTALQNVYGGGYSANAGTTNITCNGATAVNIFGGSNTLGTVTQSNVIIASGKITNVYGGNNAGGNTTESNVNINGGTVERAFGGGNQAEGTTSNVNINSGNALSVFGGGNQAGLTTSNVNYNGGTIENIFGGSNQSGTVANTNVKIEKGIENVSSGVTMAVTLTAQDSQAWQTTIYPTVIAVKIVLTNNSSTKVDNWNTYLAIDNTVLYNNDSYSNIVETNGKYSISQDNRYYGINSLAANGGTYTIKFNVFSSEPKSNNTSYSNGFSGIGNNGNTYEDGNIGFTTVYGGNNKGGSATTSNVILNSGSVYEIFGGNYQAGTTTTSNVTVNGGNVSNVYGGGDRAVTNETNVYINNKVKESVYGGGNAAGINTNTHVTLSNADIVGNLYGGGNQGTVGGDTNITISGSTLESDVYAGGNGESAIVTGNTNLTINGETATTASKSIFGGGNAASVNTDTNINISNTDVVENLYGGGNQGTVAGNTNVTISGSSLESDVYAGGNGESAIVTGSTNLTINGATATTASKSIFGGGNAAKVNTDTSIHIENATVTDNVYGGGNEGEVLGSTNVHIKNSSLLNNLYAGGNGSTAIVYKNTNLIMEGTTNNITNSVFGGGNQAATGTSGNNNSTSTVNIVGGTIGKNVYGGANTSVVYGSTYTNIGYDAVNNTDLTIGNITISGTVFGGGEANALGSEVYDFSFISVTKGIQMNINGNGHSIYSIKGSIFGSGNASSTSGDSYINIKNYGTALAPKSNVSIQRATLVTLDNSAISLSGATDRTNEYSSVYFTLSRIDELKIKNNSTLYLNYGANLLKKFTSAVDVNGTETKAQVTIDETTGETTRNTDNRIYMAEGKNLNIATNEQVTAYGEISGMTFFGLFTNTMNPSTSTGLYNDDYQNGDEITNAGTFSSNSYVLGQHKEDHDTTIDGFYSNYDDEDNQGYIKCKYIGTTPKDDLYYIWLVGIEMDVTTFEISLTGSKYATLGTYELALTGFAVPNTKFILNGFSAGLADGISLINSNNIESVALDENTANTVFGLSMKSGNNGWKTDGTTEFLTANGGSYNGDTTYNSDNSTYTPALNFCFYHSENITIAQNLGSVKIRFQAQIPVDDLNYTMSYIDINVTLLTALYQDDYYEAAITPGEKFELFTTTQTSITDSSMFSTYYSLYIPDYSDSKYYNNYSSYKHVLTSRTSSGAGYTFPVNTKITMIDMITNKYYYYVVSSSDETSNKYIYNLSDFILMGSNDTPYDEQEAETEYYNENKDLIYENFIFHVDFGEAIIPSNIINNNLLMELRDSENQTLVGVLGIQRDAMVYSVYKDNDAKIKVSETVSENPIYVGDRFILTVTTDYEQKIVSSNTIFDTQYFGKQMGIKISIYDSNGERLNSDSLLGVTFTLDGKNYYPRIDGTIRINIAEKISNVLSRIYVDTSNNNTLATGTYTIKVESFGSADGIYYGVTPSDTATLTVNIIKSSYGLTVSSEDRFKIIDKDTGENQSGVASLSVKLRYSSILEHPNVTVSLYRRKYDNIYSQEYELVDFQDYTSRTLTAATKQYEYVAVDGTASNITYDYALNSNLLTGTYKLVYKLYDINSYIGEAYEYIIIK